MKKSFLIFVLTAFSTMLFAQQSIDKIMELSPKEVNFYDAAAATYSVVMPYGKSNILSEKLPKVEDLEQLVSIDLVYTEFRRSERFNQPKLNRYRLESLKKAMPELFKLENIQWNIIEQTGADNQADAEKLFHGFVFNMVEKRGTDDIERIDDIVNGKLEIEDSTVLEVFNRHNWDKMLITADLTGSMSPYIGQVLLWFKLNETDKKAKYFMFFNDGDLTPDEDKKVGKTGGLYASPATNYKDIENLAYKTIRNGDGGDWKENDIEALYNGIKNCPECKDIILIADNDSPMRDFSMIVMIKKPVRVILCGVESYINPQYLNLAKATGGSIHTMEQDITNLMQIKEGETIEIKGKTYKIYKGNFVIVKS
jgi:nitrate reductase NapAB chaperone NapD